MCLERQTSISTAIRIALSALTERERTVIVGRNSGATLQELADEFGRSKERIRQIESCALRKARKALCKRQIEPGAELADEV